MGTEASVPAALCIVGMHRSGTSVVSALLQSSGLDIGQRLLGATVGNVKGHFEDLDFFQLHVQILKSQRITSTGFTLQRDLPIGKAHVRRARALIAERRRRGVAWGWKDPRTTLFLDFWQEMVPEAHFLILYRCPWDVVDSFSRRGDKAFRSNLGFAVQIWSHYNRLLLDFFDRFPERCLCVNSYRAVQSPGLLLEALSKKFALSLGPVAELYEPSLLHREGLSPRMSLVENTCPEVLEVYEQLNLRAGEAVVEGVGGWRECG
ncbi:MAG TPA: sulfotransferase [Gemmataceae bacterium]|nr:sulfotransferase [Gemmataceae bacterium]